MVRRKVILSFLLVLVFLAHDAWMVVAHAGHVGPAPTPTIPADNAPPMGDTAHAGHHGGRSTEASLPDVEPVTAMSPATPGPMSMTACATIRLGTLGQLTDVPGPTVSMPVLPILSDVADQVNVQGRLDWRPPGIPPNVRRAFLQIYRE